MYKTMTIEEIDEKIDQCVKLLLVRIGNLPPTPSMLLEIYPCDRAEFERQSLVFQKAVQAIGLICSHIQMYVKAREEKVHEV